MSGSMKRIALHAALVAFIPLALFSCGSGGGGGGGGVGGSSDNGSIADSAAPTAPGSLTATAVSADQINITWTGSTDNKGVTGYEVWRGSAKLATVTRLSYNDTGLTANTSYSYAVKARDGAGNISVASNTASATTLASGTAGLEQVAPDMSSVPVSMTFDERMAALDTVAAFWTANATSDLDAGNSALVAYINTLPAFADAGISPDKTVWSRFKDGRPVGWLTTKRVGITTANSLSRAKNAIRSASLPSPRNGEIPQGGKAVMIDVDGAGFGGPSQVNDWLNKEGTGYSSVLLGGSLVDLERQIKDVSVLYFSTHGMLNTTKDGTRTYLIATGTRFSGSSGTNEDLLREQMYNEGVIEMLLIQKRDGTAVRIWAISEKFVSAYWSFAPDSLIVIDTCSLFNQDTPARIAVGASFRSTLAKKSGNKTTVVGWSDNVSAGFASDAIRLFFDRALGANNTIARNTPGAGAYQPESPPQRPFTYREVYDWMAANDKITDPAPPPPPAKLKLEERGTTFGQLVPSILTAEMYHTAPGSEHAGEWILELAGTFGPAVQVPGAGTVTVGNTSLAIVDWQDGIISARLPASMDSPGFSGDIVVEVRGHKSNAVPLTRWTGTVTQVRTGMVSDGGRAEFSCPVRATGDVHFERAIPGETPWIVKSMYVQVPADCDYTFSGAWSDNNADYVLSGSGVIPPNLIVGGIGGVLSMSMGGASVTSVFPLDFFSTFSPSILPVGTLKTTDRSDGSVSTRSELVSWSGVGGFQTTNRVRLDSDYNLTGTLDCKDPVNSSPPETCTETWNLKPFGLTAPTNKTQR